VADIDEVSRQLGSLAARVDEAMRQNTAIFMKMDNTNQELIEQRGAIKLLSSQFVDHKAHNATELAKLHAVVKDVDAIKDRGKGLLLGLGIVGGGGGMAGALTAVKVWLAGGG